MTEGIKHDGGKVQPALVLETMARALQAVCEVGTFGAQKYSADNWLLVPGALSRYRNAKHRHMLAEAVGETHDPESGLLHAAHEAWNALAALELMLRNTASEQASCQDIKDEVCDVLHLPEDVIVPVGMDFISVHENGQSAAHVERPHLQLDGADLCWHPTGESKYLGVIKGAPFGLYQYHGEHWLLVEGAK